MRIWQPWSWMFLAFATTVPAFVWARCSGQDRVPFDIVQVGLLLVGLLAAGISIWMRCAGAASAGLNNLPEIPRRRALYALAVVHGAVALAVSAWVIVKLGDGRDWPGDLGGTLLLWLLTVPWCGYSAYQLTRFGGKSTPLESRFESALLVTQAGVVSLLASWALFWGTEFSDLWDSLRLFLAVVSAFAFLAAPLIAASSPVRRIAVSSLIVLHFAAVLCAVLSAPPGPWIVGQVQHWIFRPYISFMYLGNAYRFYSPEPGPASQLWCRVEYEAEDSAGQKNLLARWTKIPDMDDEGNPRYPTSVQYTRRLSLTENVAHTATVSTRVQNDKGEPVIPPYILRRDQHSTTPLYTNVLGVKAVENAARANPIKVPYHPDAALNYQPPTTDARLTLSSYARYLLHQSHPEHPKAKPVSVKIYRVQHQILPAVALAAGADPRDWINYFPYYMGEFDTEGRLLDPDDPFLYWLLPMVRENASDPQSRLKCYVFQHAGDADWIRETPKW